MNRLLESALKNDEKTSKSDFLKIFYSCLEDELFLDEFRAYMKQYMFHSLKQSKLKSITEPTRVIKCHSVSPKVQSMNLLIADYLLRQDFLYTLSVFSSEAPNLKNLTSFSHYVNRLANDTSDSFKQLDHVVPKLASKDVKDILECLGLSPHCEESVEARQQYMDCDEGDPLLLCLLSTLVSTLQSINRCPRCKVSYDEFRSQMMYEDVVNPPSAHAPEFSPWQNEMCRMLQQYSLGPLEAVQLVQNLTVIINKELEASETKMETHLTEKEEQLRKYEEVFSENMEQAERHLLEQKQSLEKELARKQKELQDLAKVLSKKKANISEAVRILQKQKDLLTERENEFHSMMTTLNEQLELRAHHLQVKEKNMQEGFDKLNKQKETFYEELLKVCTGKAESGIKGNSSSNIVDEGRTPNDYSNGIKEKNPRNIVDESRTSNDYSNGIKENNSRNIVDERRTPNDYSNGIKGKKSKNIEKESRTPNDHLNAMREPKSTNIKQVAASYPKTNKDQSDVKCANKTRETYSKTNEMNWRDNRNRVNDLNDGTEENTNRIESQELIALLKTIQVQSEAMKSFLEERGQVKPVTSELLYDECKEVQKGSLLTSGIAQLQAGFNTPGRCVREKQYNTSSPLPPLGDSCRVNDENTICDRCGSEVILKFHINDKGQKSTSCSKSMSRQMNNYLSPIEDESVGSRCRNTSTLENRGHRERCDNGSSRASLETSDREHRGREMKDSARLQTQMAQLMTRFEQFSANQSGVSEKGKESLYNLSETNSSKEKRPTKHLQYKMNPQPPYLTTGTAGDSWDTLKYQNPPTDPMQEDLMEDPVDLSRQTLARLSSQISALDASFDKYRDSIRRDNDQSDREGNVDIRRLEKLLDKGSSDVKKGNLSQKESPRSYLHQAGTQFFQPNKSLTHPEPSPKLFKNTRTGSLFPSGKHQHVPAYFSANVPFWRSYLKTYYFPPNGTKPWQEHFQDFAGQVDRQTTSEMRQAPNDGRKNDSTRVEHVLDRLLGETKDGGERQRTPKAPNRAENEINAQTRQRSEKSNETHRSNRFLDQTNHSCDENRDPTEKQTVENEHIDYRTDSLNQRTNADKENIEYARNDKLGEKVEEEKLDETHVKQLQKTLSKQNSKQLEAEEEQKETQQNLRKLLRASNNTCTKLPSDFQTPEESNVVHEDNLNSVQFTSDQKSWSEDVNVKNQDVQESFRNTGDNKDTSDKDNSVVEYNPGGSLLFQIQDSDESML